MLGKIWQFSGQWGNLEDRLHRAFEVYYDSSGERELLTRQFRGCQIHSRS